jgi:Flp pilus assembly protein TadG
MNTSSKRERGTAALEFVGAFPFLLLAGMIALQFGLVGWATVSTNDAARAAAARRVAWGATPRPRPRRRCPETWSRCR